MKKFLCAMLAICMLCGGTALVGCKKKKGGNGNNQQSSSQSISQGNGNSSVEVGGEWLPEWDN